MTSPLRTSWTGSGQFGAELWEFPDQNTEAELQRSEHERAPRNQTAGVPTLTKLWQRLLLCRTVIHCGTIKFETWDTWRTEDRRCWSGVYTAWLMKSLKSDWKLWINLPVTQQQPHLSVGPHGHPSSLTESVQRSPSALWRFSLTCSWAAVTICLSKSNTASWTGTDSLVTISLWRTLSSSTLSACRRTDRVRHLRDRLSDHVLILVNSESKSNFWSLRSECYFMPGF